MPRLLSVDVLRANVSYDPETGLFTRIKNHPKRKYLAGSITGVLRPDGYLQVMIEGQIYLAHRLAWLYVHGVMPTHYIDHINGNTFDNVIANLRDATVEQNNQNAKTRKDSTSGIKGVYIHKLTGKWAAACQSNKKRKHLGLFDTIAEAEKAVKSYREQLHGEFARHT